MAIVDSDDGIVRIGEIANFGQLRQVAIHAEHAIGEDHLEATVFRVFELRLQVVHVVVLVAKPFGLAQPYAVDDARVVEFIGKDRVLLGEQRFEQPAVGIETGDVKDRIGLVEELGDPLLAQFVNALRAADETHR